MHELDWIAVIFDNLLVMAHDYLDLYDKLVKVVTRCDEKNVKLKMANLTLASLRLTFSGTKSVMARTS